MSRTGGHGLDAGRSDRARRVASWVGAALLCLSVVPAWSQFVPSETRASSHRGLIDPEFNHTKNQLTWVDLSGNIWVGGIDKATGELVPRSGRGKLIERGAAPEGGLGFTLNGPEWVYGGTTDRIVYTRQLSGLPETPMNARIGVAWQKPDGKWTRRTLSPDVPLNGPYGSENVGDPRPTISYNDAFGNRFWRELDRPETEEALPGLPQAQFPVARFARGQRAAVYVVNVGGTDQVFPPPPPPPPPHQLKDGIGNKKQH